MSSIAVEPSIKGQYADTDQNWSFAPILGSSAPTYCLVSLIQNNLVNEEDVWKGIVH